MLKLNTKVVISITKLKLSYIGGPEGKGNLKLNGREASRDYKW